MNSPQQRHEVRLRGLGGLVVTSGAVHVAGTAPERMNSPLENHEVRLRGLWPRDRHIQQAWRFRR
jgi:hypothetical protein